MGNEKRFQLIYTQGISDVTRVLLDTATGMLYLEMHNGYAGGITPLLDAEGKPMKWKPEDWT
ncbi:DUF6440 family protein [Flavonifractor hominis]|uniref:DUF6440 family protein n=1 Tax=Flavonifractor hominis TaxID=3133178 RepID=A0ABV1ESF8_9FIRM